MKKTLFIVFFCSLLFASLSKASQVPLDRIVAVLNNTVIVESELNQAIQLVQNQFKNNHTPLPPLPVLRKQVLDQLINKKLQLEIADNANIHASDEDVNKAIASIANNNHISVEVLYAELAKRGLSKTAYRKQIHDEYILHQVQQQAVAAKITVSPEEVDDFMRSTAWLSHNSKEYHLEDILIALPDAPTTADITKAKERAANIADQLRSGGNFSTAAVAESNGTKALQGGDLGWRKLPEIPSSFANQILQADEGAILGPIQAPNGFHIIHIAGIRQVTVSDKTGNVRKQVEQLIFERKFEESLQNWISKIRHEAFVNIDL